MKISVVTVCFNAGATIGYTLESFFAQSHPDKELLIIDGGSTDDTPAIVATFASENLRYIREPDRGIYDAMNKGLARFSGDAVGFLNADDRFAGASTLSLINAGLEKAPVVTGNLDFVEDHATSRVVRRWRGTPHRPGSFRSGWMPAHPTFYIHREVAEAVGSFDLSMPIAADYDFMLRALEVHGFPSVFLEDVLINMQAGGTSNGSLKAYLRSNLESLRARRRHLGSGMIDLALVAKPLRKLPQFLGRR